jgi:CRP-like cAMP-binding protein
MSREYVEVLRRLPLFARLSERSLEEVAARVVLRTLPAGRILFRRGAPCEGVFVVVRGRVRVYRANREGKEQVLHAQGPGQPLAEVPLFDGGPYPASARTEEATELLFLPRAAFMVLYRSEPEIADSVIAELGRRLRRAVRLIEKLSLRDVPSRVGLTLLEYAAAAGAGPGEVFHLPRSQAELADELGTTRESVARALRTLADEGLVRRERRRVRLPDPEALETRCFGI